MAMDDIDHLRTLVERGYSLRGIADELSVSTATVRRRLERAGLRTNGRAWREESRSEVIRACRSHGDAVFVMDSDGSYRCRRCRVEAVVRRRQVVRDRLIEEAGGECALCGYHRHTSALHFHHVDPAEKSFTIRNGDTRSLTAMRDEMHKCVLLCANCHAEVEVGAADVRLCPTIQPRSDGGPS